jgi:hypothetical protein
MPWRPKNMTDDQLKALDAAADAMSGQFGYTYEEAIEAILRLVKPEYKEYVSDEEWKKDTMANDLFEKARRQTREQLGLPELGDEWEQ